MDIESLAADLKTEMQCKEKLTFTIPLYGDLTFHPSDVDSLYEMITGKNLTTETMEVPGNETD
ncbi:MAG: hypothetical protein K2J72_08015 [Oscillospiraceae bacterium]|nr:hypothetical protein [Oscillospiraceae bacterium]